MNQASAGLWIEADTAALAADIALTLTDTFTVKRYGTGSGDAAGPNDTYSAVAELTGIPGAIAEDTRSQRVEAPNEDQARTTTSTAFLIHLLPDVWEDLLLSDRIVHDASGLEYDVIAIVEPTTEQAATLVKVEKVNE